MKGKYLFLAYNKRSFRVNEFGEDTFEDRVLLNEIPLDVNNQVMNRFKVRKEVINSAESWGPFA